MNDLKRRTGALCAVAVAVAMAVVACSPPAAPTSDGSTPADTTTPETTERETKHSEQPSTPATAPSTDPGTGIPCGLFGAFGSKGEACAAVSATVLSVLVLPMAAVMGGQNEEVGKARAELAKMQGQVPGELRPYFEKLQAVTDAAGPDFSKFNNDDFEAAMGPIESWMTTNCK